MRMINQEPNLIDLIDFFCITPNYIDEKEGRYVFSNTYCNMELVFSYCCVEGWIRVSLKQNKDTILDYTSELIECFEIKQDTIGKYIFWKIGSNISTSSYTLRIHPKVYFKCTTLEI